MGNGAHSIVDWLFGDELVKFTIYAILMTVFAKNIFLVGEQIGSILYSLLN